MYGRLTSFLDAVKTKIRQGKYDASRASKLWQYYVDEGARRYVKEFGAPGDPVSTVFDAVTRKHVAEVYAKHFYDGIKRGEY
jgi:hypothetical protein